MLVHQNLKISNFYEHSTYTYILNIKLWFGRKVVILMILMFINTWEPMFKFGIHQNCYSEHKQINLINLFKLFYMYSYNLNVYIIQGDSKLLSGFPFMGHRNTNNNFKITVLLQYES
jgi:hypothetical protein